jgi:hypothetical protein
VSSRGRASKWAAVEAHVQAVLREYRGMTVEALRALPPNLSLPDFTDERYTWLIYMQNTGLKDGGAFVSVCASRETFWARLAFGDGFVMDANGQTRDLTNAERRDLT